MRYFPIAGVPRVVCGAYDWRTYPNGTRKFHDAVDLCAPTSSPVVAVDDGVARWGQDPVGGSICVLTLADGSAFYMAHMLEVQSGSRRVLAGTQLGLVDSSGNASLPGIPPHLHIQAWSNGTFAGPHPDPTADLMAAEVLSAPIGSSGVAGIASKIALTAFALAALIGVGYGVGYFLERRS